MPERDVSSVGLSRILGVSSNSQGLTLPKFDFADFLGTAGGGGRADNACGVLRCAEPSLMSAADVPLALADCRPPSQGDVGVCHAKQSSLFPTFIPLHHPLLATFSTSSAQPRSSPHSARRRTFPVYVLVIAETTRDIATPPSDARNSPSTS